MSLFRRVPCPTSTPRPLGPRCQRAPSVPRPRPVDVGALVLAEVGGVVESAVAEAAAEGALAGVDARVAAEHRGLGEALAAHAAVVGPLARMHPLVVSHV